VKNTKDHPMNLQREKGGFQNQFNFEVVQADQVFNEAKNEEKKKRKNLENLRREMGFEDFHFCLRFAIASYICVYTRIHLSFNRSY